MALSGPIESPARAVSLELLLQILLVRRLLLVSLACKRARPVLARPARPLGSPATLD